MQSIVEFGKRGSEHIDDTVRLESEATLGQIAAFAHVIKQFPRQIITDETADGIKRDIGVRSLQLKSPQVFELLHRASVLEPLVYAQVGGMQIMGMLSPNYDEHGLHRLPSLKVIPLKTPYPLTNQQKPDARMATMLAGAVGSERKGIGGHNGNVSHDFEHSLTIAGAVSLGQPEVALGHKNHAVRRKASLATGLTDGSLGTLYIPDRSEHDFTGYGQPLFVERNTTRPTDFMFMPDSFLDGVEAYGISYSDASAIMFGAGLRALYARRGLQEASTQIRALAEKVH